MRKPKDDPIARTVAENQVTELIDRPGVDAPSPMAKDVLGGFPAVEFETTTRVVQGQTIGLRRLVIVGPWEVDPGAVAPKTGK